MKIMKVMSMLLVCSALLLTGCGEEEGVDVIETEEGIEASVDVSVIDKFESKLGLTFEEGTIINLIECVDFPEDVVAGVESVKFQWEDGLWYERLRASDTGEQSLDAVVKLTDGRTFDTKVTYTVVGATTPISTPEPTATPITPNYSDDEAEKLARIKALQDKYGVKEYVAPDYTGMTLNDLIREHGQVSDVWTRDGKALCATPKGECPLDQAYYDVIKAVEDDPAYPNPANVTKYILENYGDVIKVDGPCL